MRIKKNDTVLVRTGDQRGTRGKVLSVDHEAGRVVVEGVNLVYKHVRRSQKNPQGGRLRREAPIALSKVQFVCGSCNQAARVGARETAGGGKERYCKKCNTGLGEIRRPKSVQS